MRRNLFFQGGFFALWVREVLPELLHAALELFHFAEELPHHLVEKLDGAVLVGVSHLHLFEAPLEVLDAHKGPRTQGCRQSFVRAT